MGDGRGVLCAAEDVGEEGMVVETPDAVRAGGLEGVGLDEAADEVEIRVEDFEHDQSLDCLPIVIPQGGGGGGRGWESSKFPDTAKEGEEAEFVACAIIEALGAAEAREEVGREFLGCGGG